MIIVVTLVGISLLLGFCGFYVIANHLQDIANQIRDLNDTVESWKDGK
jgi:ABC-type transporter Mla maintaining outer membrane lipid asymmetry permease subunit MlaE